MANFIFWSDLHCEFRPFDLPDPSAFRARPDAVLLAGDTDLHPGHLETAGRIAKTYGCPVVALSGNHEFYHRDYDTVRREEAEIAAQMRADGIPVHVLNGTSVVIAGTRIVGATLWTDFELNPAFGFLSRKIATRYMADYRVIGKSGRLLEPLDTIAMHLEEKAAIKDILAQPHDGPTVVMSHHLPCRELIGERYTGNDLNSAFASDLLREFRDLAFDAWIFGHSHDNRELDVPGPGGKTQRFLSNPRGYPDEETRFDPLRMLAL